MSNLSKNISEVISGINMEKPTLSSLAQKGDDDLVTQFMTENIKLGDQNKETAQSQLYIAAFWGLRDVVKKLVEEGADVNCQNAGTLWTPLHAATFQEHGKVVMCLLEHDADPLIPDAKGRTSADFASASDIVWPFFAAIQCRRTTKPELLQKCVLRPALGSMALDGAKDQNALRAIDSTPINFAGSRKTSSGSPAQSEQNAYSASVDGDVLAGHAGETDKIAMLRQQSKDETPSFSAWRQ